MDAETNLKFKISLPITLPFLHLCCVYSYVCLLRYSFDPRAFRWAQTMRLAVEEINQNMELLPNYTLGHKIFDSCAHPLTGQRAALAVLNGLSEDHSAMCSSASSLLAVIGDSGSAQSIVISRMLQPFRIPMVSWDEYVLIHQTRVLCKIFPFNVFFIFPFLPRSATSQHVHVSLTESNFPTSSE